MTTKTTTEKPKRVAKIYQCDRPGYNIAIDQNDNPWSKDEKDERVIAAAGVISFHPETEPLTNTIFGEVASDNPVILKRFQIAVKFNKQNGDIIGTRDATPEEIEDMIENTNAFKNCKDHKTMGVRGIWLKSERQEQLRKEVGVAGGVTSASVYDKLSNEVLQLHIETAGGKYPVKADNESEADYHASLVRVAVELESGK